MFEELVNQAKRLFSSKRNAGKLVYNLTDKLHYYKQLLLATSIVLLLGYSQFRAHFLCQGSDRVDKITLTNLCWINGTTTVNRIDGSTAVSRQRASKHSVLVNNPRVELPAGSSILEQLVSQTTRSPDDRRHQALFEVNLLVQFFPNFAPKLSCPKKIPIKRHTLTLLL